MKVFLEIYIGLLEVLTYSLKFDLGGLFSSVNLPHQII